MNLLRNFLFTIVAAAPLLFADALDTTPKKIGPVSYYGALHTQGNKIIGAKNNQQAMLRGVSLFWSDATGNPYYKNTVINWATDNLSIDVFRFAMGIQYYDSNGGTSEPIATANSYMGAPEGLMNLLDKMVAAAIENDVYIIVDWHSHRAHLETSAAQTFFSNVAQKYKNVPNIIYEIYNEPVNGSGGNWNNIKSYANTVSSAIRKYTDNLIIVGTSSWSQNPQEGANSPVSATNVAYVFHFYAATHSKNSYSGNIDAALSRGYPVFISEWGTTSANGDGTPSASATNEWLNYMEQKQIPNCNWSFRQYTSHTDNKSEQSAFFEGSTPLITEKALSEAKVTTSGDIVKKYLTSHGRTWADSVTKGSRSGGCAISHITALETDGTISGKLKSGCTYTSSNESVVTVSGTTLNIKGYGYSILSANDGTKTAVTIKSVPNQTINGFTNMTCNYTASCISDIKTSRTVDYDNDGKQEWAFPPSGATDQGMSYTLKSLDPETVNAKKAKCTNINCSGSQYNNQVWMYEFNNFGTARIVATANATTGYRALSDTVLITYAKGENRIPGFGNKKMNLGATAEDALPDTSIFGTKVTYTFDGESSSPYLQKVGFNAVAGNQKAIVYVTATIPETNVLAEYVRTAVFTIGDTVAPVIIESSNSNPTPNSSGSYTPGGEPIIPPEAIATVATTRGLKANVLGGMLHINSSKPEPIYVDIYDMLGNRVFQQLTVDATKTPHIGLSGLSQGNYVVRIRQGSERLTLRWVNK